MTTSPINPAAAGAIKPTPQEAVQAPTYAYSFMLLAWMFDFRASSAGAGLAVQGVLAAAYFLGLLLFLVGDRGRRARIHGLNMLAFCIAVFISVGTISGLLHGQTLYQIFRNSLSVLVYMTAVYATARMMVSGSLSDLRRLLAWLCLGYLIAAPVILWLNGHQFVLGKIRYEIIGGSAIPALALLALLLVTNITRIEQATLLFNLAILFLAVTRTFGLVLLAQFVPLLHKFRRTFTPRMIIVGGMGLLLIAILFAAGVLDPTSWLRRLFDQRDSSGTDITYLTRASEWQFMSDSIWSGPYSLLFGSGLAAQTKFWLPSELGGGYEQMTGFGHGQYLSIIFIAGAVGGFPLLLAQAGHVVRSYRFVSALLKSHRVPTDAMFLGAWGGLTILGCFANNFFASNFYFRGEALWFGVGTGMLLGAQALFDPANRVTGTERRLPLRDRNIMRQA